MTVVSGRSCPYPNLLLGSAVAASTDAFVLAEFVAEYCKSDVIVSATILGDP